MDMEKLFERLTAKMDADRRTDQEEIKSNQAKLLATLEADREERRVGQEKLLKEMKAWREEMTSMRNKWVNDNHNEETPTSPDRKSKAAQKAEAPSENATVMPVEEPKKKRRRDRKLAAEHRRQKQKNSTLESCGPPKELADKKMPRRATVARQMRECSV
jgi:hypothetical protein